MLWSTKATKAALSFWLSGVSEPSDPLDTFDASGNTHGSSCKKKQHLSEHDISQTVPVAGIGATGIGD